MWELCSILKEILGVLKEMLETMKPKRRNETK